jgi:hypothetical protein
MRPKGTVHLALLNAARAQSGHDHDATLREMAQLACVGVSAARCTVGGMRRSGALVNVLTRRVPYRNRPVAEYAIPTQQEPGAASGVGALGPAMSAWLK